MGVEEQPENPPCSRAQRSGGLELELLGLQVGRWIEVKRASLGGFRNQAGILINLEAEKIAFYSPYSREKQWKDGKVSNSRHLLKSTDR